MARRYGSAIFAAILVGLVLIAYRAAPDNGFHFDDYANIVEQDSLHVDDPTVEALVDASLSGEHPQRFVANLTLAVDWWRGDGSPRPFQWTNLFIHLLGALLVFLLLKTVLGIGRDGTDPVVAAAAFFGATWWALHPIQVQAVTYIVQRMASLAAVLVIAAVLAYVHGRLEPGRRWRWMTLAGICTLLAAFSKENAWVLPLLFILAEFGLVRGSGSLIRSRLDWVPILFPVGIGLYLAAALWTGTGTFAEWVQRAYDGRSFTLGERLLTQPRVIVFHFSQLIWPLPGRFSIEHAFPLSRSLLNPVSTVPAMLLVLGWIGTGLWWLLSPARRLAGFFVLWVPLTLAIESSVIALEIVFEHRMYLPAVGVAGLLALAARWAFSRRAIAVTTGVLCATALVALLVSTSIRVPEWRSDVSLLQRAYEHAPDSPRVVGNLGVAYMNAGQLESAGSLLKRATELDPGWPKAWYNLALWHAKKGNAGVAESGFRRTLQLSPESVPTWQGLGDVYWDAGRARDARAAYDEALRIAPQRAEVLQRRGRVLSDAFDLHDAALRDLDAALAAGADGYRLRVDRGVVLGRLGRSVEAIEEFTVAIGLQPDNPQAYYDRGLTYLRSNRFAAARDDFSTAVRLDPAHAGAHIGLASVNLLEQDYDAARAGFGHALLLEPENVSARFNLGVALEFLGDVQGARQHFEQACADGHERACRKAGSP
jgi:Flp pilus assembly protein TadD